MTPEPRQPDAQRPLRLVAPDDRVDGPTTDSGAEPGWGIEACADVIRVFGAATVMRLRADDSLREYACPFCDQPGLVGRYGDDDPRIEPTVTDSVTGPSAVPGASLIVFRYVSGPTVVRLAHTTCSPSAVVRMLSTPTRLRHRVRATCWLRPIRATSPTTPASPSSAASASALLLIDNQVRTWPRSRALEHADGYPLALDAAGFTQLTDLDHRFPPIAGLTVTITPFRGGTPRDPGRRRLRVAHPQAVVFDGVVATPSTWLRHAAQEGAVTVLTGTALIPRRTPDRRSPDDARAFLDGVSAAVAAGRAWAALATLAPAGTTPLEGQHNPKGHPTVDGSPSRKWAG